MTNLQSFKNFIAGTVLIGTAFAGAAFSQAGEKVVEKPVPAEILVTKVNDDGLKNVLKPAGRPLVVNFWATWCAPCIEEFPDLVKIDNDFRGKIDLVTVSLDDIADIDKGVPDFLKRMKAEMPTYLLVSQDETVLISSINKDWSGGLPFTVIYNAAGEQVYFREGKFNPEILRAAIEKAVGK